MSLPRMSIHIGDYLKDTRHLRADGHGAYLLLIMHYWATGRLPDDDRQLASIACLTDREWKQIRPTIRAFFGDGWSHKRIDAELVTAQAKYERRAAAGKRGGEARAAAKQSPSNATAELKQPLTLTDKELGADDDASAREPASRGGVTPEAFDLASSLATAQGIDPDDPRCIGTPYTAQSWLSKGWRADVILHAVKLVMSRRTEAPGALRYFEKAIAQAHADADRPLPTAQPSNINQKGPRNGGFAFVAAQLGGFEGPGGGADPQGSPDRPRLVAERS